MNQRHEEEEPGKRKRLDELFADEPFLSPTMKARRLHEKLSQQSAGLDAGDTTIGQGMLREAFVQAQSDSAVKPELNRAPFNEQHQEQASTPVSLIDAAIFLRSRGTQAPRSMSAAAQQNLTAFRDNALLSWLRPIQDR
jgi:hypothetical protein